MWGRKRIFRRKRRKIPVSKHYQEHKDLARSLIHQRLEYWNEFYNFEYKRVAVRNQKTCWGSCSEHKNLNFNYKIAFLPQELMDYVIVHELCHLKEMNHSKDFWTQVARTLPEHKEYRRRLRSMTHIPNNGFPSSMAVLD